MKTRNLFGAVLLGLALSSPALAQVMPSTGGTLGGTPNAAGTVPTTGTTAPGQNGSLINSVPPGAVPANATTPIGTSGTGTLYPTGNVPDRNLNGGTLRADQPVGSGRPAVPGSQPTRRINKGRSSPLK